MSARKLFIVGLLLAVLSAAVAVCLLPRSPLAVARAKVRPLMTRAEVEHIAGPPGDRRTTVHGSQTWARPPFEYADFETWFTDEGILVVYFSANGTVVGKELVDYEPGWLETMVARMRAWL